MELVAVLFSESTGNGMSGTNNWKELDPAAPVRHTESTRTFTAGARTRAGPRRIGRNAKESFGKKKKSGRRMVVGETGQHGVGGVRPRTKSGFSGRRNWGALASGMSGTNFP
jgi:hypothetical protein